MNNALTVGVIGCGEIAEQYHLPLLATLPEFDVRWTCDLKAARAQLTAKRFGIAASFSALDDCTDVDAVIVATPVGSRVKLLDAITGRGWHAFCEKPFAPDFPQHESILAQAERRKIVLGCGYMRRFYWATRTAASMVGVLFGGQPLDVTVSDCQRMTRSAHGGNWYLMDPQASGGGFLMETGSHLIDQALTVTRAAGVNVSAARQSVLNGIDYESLATAKGCSTDGGELSYHILVSRLQDMWSGITISSHSLRLEVPLVPGTPLILTNSVNGAQCVIEAPLKGGLDLIGSYSEQLVRFGRRVRQSDVGSNDQETGVLTTKVLSECYSQSRRCLAGECK